MAFCPNTVESGYASTVKPPKGEHPADQQKCSLLRGVHFKRSILCNLDICDQIKCSKSVHILEVFTFGGFTVLSLRKYQELEHQLVVDFLDRLMRHHHGCLC